MSKSTVWALGMAAIRAEEAAFAAHPLTRAKMAARRERGRGDNAYDTDDTQAALKANARERVALKKVAALEAKTRPRRKPVKAKRGRRTVKTRR